MHTTQPLAPVQAHAIPVHEDAMHAPDYTHLQAGRPRPTSSRRSRSW